MGVYIKWMAMPENCSECPVALSGKYCRINKTYTTYIKLPIRPDYCPLVEVPTPHGDLIDRQKLLDDNKHLEYPTNEKYRRDRAWAVGFNSGARHCNEHAVYAKTVIEAEDGT